MDSALKRIYTSVSACVRDKCLYTDLFKSPGGVKKGCLLSPLMFSVLLCFLINKLAVELSKNGKHCMQLIPGAIDISMLLLSLIHI